MSTLRTFDEKNLVCLGCAARLIIDPLVDLKDLDLGDLPGKGGLLVRAEAGGGDVAVRVDCRRRSDERAPARSIETKKAAHWIMQLPGSEMRSEPYS